MRKHACATVIILSALLPAAAQENRVWPSEVVIPNTRQLKFDAVGMDIPLTISISIPLIPPPKEGYPVLYVLDGEGYFSTAANFSIILQNRAAVVVGIGHDALNDKAVIARYAPRKPGDNAPIGMRDIGPAFNGLRDRTLTPPIAPENRAPTWFNPGAGGDVDAFLKLIETEIKPRVEALVSINRDNQALFGHSFGGLAVVRALFTAPLNYRSFIASSPSLWFDANAVLKDEAAFATMVLSGKTTPRVLITSAAQEEGGPTTAEIVARMTPDRATEYTAYANRRDSWGEMMPLARSLAERLSALKGGTGWRVQYRVIADADHAAAAFTSIGAGMHFAFDP